MKTKGIIVFSLLCALFFWRVEKGMLPVPLPQSVETHNVAEFAVSEDSSLQGASHQLFLRSVHTLFRQTAVVEIISEKIRLEELLKQTPSMASTVPQLVGEKQTPLRPRLALISALGEVGTVECQRALQKIALSPSYEQQVRVQAIITATELSEPAPDSVNALRQLASQRGEIADTATLALGIVASAIAARQPEDALAITADLYDKLERAESEGYGAVTVAIHALGNSGDSGIESVADRYVRSPSAEERALGASVLTKIESSWANRTLLELIDQDESASVRKAAVETLGWHRADENMVDRMGSLLFEEPSSSTRRSMIAYLGKQSPAFPRAREILSELILHETDQSNRERIAQILDREA